ncbi:hypothetical protein ACZ90_22730 [Streptomyces albus subsp. albus]|nr:hypothetical protein ACZ90_22730 [Streptomyces albus subsp. albus]
MGALAVTGAWAASLWVATHLHADPTLRTTALLVHLAALVLGLGAVLTIDYYGLLWLLGRRSLRQVLDFTSPLHTPVWAGLAVLTLSGTFLHPDPGAPLTRIKLVLVLLVALNGIQARALHGRLTALDGRAGPRRLLVRGALSVLVSQLAWWGAMVIGFLNSRR